MATYQFVVDTLLLPFISKSRKGIINSKTRKGLGKKDTPLTYLGMAVFANGIIGLLLPLFYQN